MNQIILTKIDKILKYYSRMIEVMKFNDFNISIFKSHKPKNCSPPPKPSPLPYTIDQNPLI